MSNTFGKIPDYFGEYIGGARRDDWQDGIKAGNLDAMNSAEIRKLVNRDNVWPLPDAIEAVEAGADPFLVYWKRVVRRTAFKGPVIFEGDNPKEKAQAYISAMETLRSLVEEVDNYNKIHVFYYKAETTPELEHCISMRALKLTHSRLSYYKRSCENSGFPYNKRKAARKAKPSFIPPQLEKIEREGPDYRNGFPVTPLSWQETFAFRGVEFGNWTSQKDRQFSLDYAFDALKDLGEAVGIEDTDIAFGGKLALAFGSRGRSGASAHYEPERVVINLTKMRGAGGTAHEWFHALDNILAVQCGITDAELASESRQSWKLPDSFNDLVKALKTDASGNPTDYYRGSRAMDRRFRKDGFGCWASGCEMAARAFACYAKDTLDRKSDYLFAHADVYQLEFEDQRICAIPQGEEREILAELFDSFFHELKGSGFFHPRTEKSMQPLAAVLEVVGEPEEDTSGEPQARLCLEADGQLIFML